MLYHLILPYSDTPLQQPYRVRVRDLRAIELYRFSCLLVVLPVFEAHPEVFANPALP